MAVLKAMLSGGARRELDFYPTPPAATRALLPLIVSWPRTVWEPCCGDGAISKELALAGFHVNSYDIADRGFGRTGEQYDFFRRTAPRGDVLITNPPFGRAHDFIQHANAIGVGHMALLLKINFFSTQKSLNAWGAWKPRVIAPMTWRLDFTGAGSPHTDCMWVLWDRACAQCEYLPLVRA